MPTVNYDFNTDFGLNESDTKIGDVIVSPLIIQWMNNDFFGMKYWYRFNLNFILQTGNYDKENGVNIVNNIVSINPYYAFTLEVSPNIEISGRIHYLWNGKNKSSSTNLEANSVQPGEADAHEFLYLLCNQRRN